jgi:hypothetical protein
MDPLVLIIIVGACAAGFVQGLSGFAFGMTAMSFWAWMVDPQLAAVLVVFCSLIGQVLTIVTARRGFNLKRTLPFVIGGALGVPVGAMILPHIDQIMLAAELEQGRTTRRGAVVQSGHAFHDHGGLRGEWFAHQGNRKLVPSRSTRDADSHPFGRETLHQDQRCRVPAAGLGAVIGCRRGASDLIAAATSLGNSALYRAFYVTGFRLSDGIVGD